MSQNSLCLKPINDLLKENFFIPSYQRGYRWTPRQVTELLDDIYTFQRDSDTKSKSVFYCLQPVVVTKRQDGSWELIDGQQRLTTMFLILSNLKMIMGLLNKEPYYLEYQTRFGSGQFLTNIDLTLKEDNIDYYHICDAYQTIDDWFRAKDGNVKISFLQCLLNDDNAGKNVKVIWYELSEYEKPVDVFIRLNMGKIPLTNGELIRGLFLRTGDSIDPITIIRQLQIAQEWDGIEKILQSDDFWYFIQKGDVAYPARIEYLFSLIITDDSSIAGSNVLTEDPYYTFISYSHRFLSDQTDSEGKKIEYRGLVDREWRQVKLTFMRFEEWFRDRTLYHLIGFLIAEGEPILSLVKQARDSHSKSKFRETLKSKIWHRVFGEDFKPEKQKKKMSRADFIREALDSLDYESHHSKIKAILLLLNIATLLQNTSSNMRFPFDSFKKERWDIEHIRSIASAMPDRIDNQKRWLEQFIDFCDSTQVNKEMLEASDNDDLQTMLDDADKLLKSDHFNKQNFEKLYNQIVQGFEGDDSGAADNTLGNLTLLDSSTNRSYKNAIFPVKRRRILGLDKEGTFVPLCTTNVFLKYYSAKIGRMMVWSDQDCEDYLGEIHRVISEFFKSMEGE